MLEVPIGGTASGIKLHFAFIAQLHGALGASELQAADATTSAIKEVRHGLTRRVAEQASSALGTSKRVAPDIQRYRDTWVILLERMKIFNDIVAKIAEVSGIQHLPLSHSECCIDPSICIIGVVCDISRKQGLSLCVA